ncbi:MAG: aspartyl/glutamyl-tRNA amidotransferase subunit A [Candidatus Diapherotrites archaeon]|nr:aspartyl/glutamyl-tRNA amidotransferase subunit A [Candidatus Diapherotrites archaeon]
MSKQENILISSKDLVQGGVNLEKRIEKQKRIINKLNRRLHAFISINEEKGEGLSLAVKDNICVKGMRATSSSKILKDYVAPYDATVVRKCRDLFYIIGKTAHDPFGAGSSGSTSDFGVTRNPIDESRVPGGSSSGNAVALATGMCDFALGTDTFGSVRAPAAFCGVVGLRPTYGLVSRYGLMDLCMSLDTIGPMARDVYGVAYILSFITGLDPRDCTTVKTTKCDYTKGLDEPILSKSTITIFRGLELQAEVEDAFEKEVERISNLGADIREVNFGKIKYAVPTYYLLMFSEFSSAMQKFDGVLFGEKRAVLSEEVKRRILLGTYITLKEHKDKWYSLALNGKRVVEKELSKIMNKTDFILTPTMPVLPWKLEDELSPVEEYMSDICTGFPALAGLPAISIPVRKMIGMQLVGKKFQEHSLLRAAKEMEK